MNNLRNSSVQSEVATIRKWEIMRVRRFEDDFLVGFYNAYETQKMLTISKSYLAYQKDSPYQLP